MTSPELNAARNLAVHARLIKDSPAWDEAIARIEKAIVSTLFDSKLNQQEVREHLYRKHLVLREVVREIDSFLVELQQLEVADNG